MHQLSRHISEQYDAELEIVRRRLMEMGGMVEQQLRDAIKAISTYDAELAAKVSARDHEVNRFEVTLDEQCIHIIARRQPHRNGPASSRHRDEIEHRPRANRRRSQPYCEDGA